MSSLLAAIIFSSSPFVVPPPYVGGNMSGGDIIDPDDIYSTCMGSDAAAAPVSVVSSKCVYPLAGAANTTGANTCLIPAPGNVQVTGVTRAGTAGDTVTFVVIKNDCTVSTVVMTEGDGTGGTYECDGAASDAVCVSNLSVAIEANATLGPLVNVVYTAASETTHFGITPGASAWLSATASDAVNTVITTGSAGQLLLAGGTQARPALAFARDTNTGLYWYGEDALVFVIGGNTAINATSTYVYTSTKWLAPTAGRFEFLSSTINSAPTDGSLYVASSSTNTNGVVKVAPQTITCADSGDGAHSACGGAQTISSNSVQLVCNDADGCTLTLAETNYSATVVGQVTLIGPAANHVDVADSAGVVELAAGAAMAMDALDTLTLSYAPAALAWVEVARAAN